MFAEMLAIEFAPPEQQGDEGEVQVYDDAAAMGFTVHSV